MIVVDEFYDNMKIYFEEMGSEYSKIIIQYISMMRQLKLRGICAGDTADELNLFIECAEKLQDATFDLSMHINKVLEGYITGVDEIDKM